MKDDWARQWRESRPTRRLVVGGVLSAALVLAVTVFVILETRAKEIADAKRELMTLNLSLAEQTARAIQGVDLVLDSVIDQVKADGIETADDFQRLYAGAETHRLLRSRVADVPQLDAVAMIASDGHLINFSRYYPIPTINVADRDYFSALGNMPTTRAYISEPVENRGTGTWTLYVARRVNGPSGEFVGLVLGAVDLRYFENLYHGLELGPGSGISLWRRDGTLLARYPSIEGVGRVFQIKSFTETLLHADAGVYETPLSIDGYRRIVATRALKDYPLVVNVTRTLDQVLADWRHTSSINATAGGLCIAAIGLVVWALVHQFGTYERLTRALGEKAEAIEARERAESQLYQSQKLDAIGQLTTGIAHDFNNLLTAIMGNLEFLSLDGQSARARRGLAAIQTAVDRAATLTGQLLAFSRKQHLSPEVVDLNRLIGNMTEMLRSTLGGTIGVELALRPSLWPALVDPVQLELVLLNLAINARDAMPTGGTLTISTDNIAIDSRSDLSPSDLSLGDYVLIAVADTGTGMTEDVLARAFDPFFTTKPPGKGTGLGLSQVYGMVQQSGGVVRIETVLERGTTVRIHLPRVEAAAEAAPVEAPASLAVADHGPALIQIVDDDAGVRETVAEMVRSLGFSVIEAADGTEALAQLAGDPRIDLVVTDFAMPGLNGVALARRARDLRPDLPVVFVTGFADVESLSGEEWVLLKPFRRDGLAAKLRLALPRRTTPALGADQLS
ncbi:hypothetical protein GCM10011611_21760 [Aliidongia dinghuensis]|uniref:histidine kinase n=1 Tax=Aliidongia dinghuensis TaxID=1867774 RepID=A0A8J3E4M4_9PROT|nr:hybrid sensor histidine kinase/response regulator [Aliidongia dinghuensis]GGF15605.1 hypothetical protein GCM10011611_21760 [Aliidongia dinghuensis]